MLQAYLQDVLVEAGCDEAGRGCLAGPVFAAAVILPKNFYHPLLNDSKQLCEKDRYTLRPVIEEQAIAYTVVGLCNRHIDKINILQAAIKGMHLAISRLPVVPQLLLIDGNRFKPYADIPYRCIIKGDATYASIAAASILAKTYRDDYMMRLHQQFPQYNWAKNKGYATKDHQVALDKYGPCRYHRTSFRLQYSEPGLTGEVFSLNPSSVLPS